MSTFPFILKATENPAYSAVGQKENIKALTDYVAEAKKYADAAKDSGANISEYVDNAKKYAESASESVINAEKAEKLSQVEDIYRPYQQKAVTVICDRR